MGITAGLLIPFLGTALGSAMVFFLRGGLSATSQKALLGFASGVMVAASVWSLLLPAIEMSEPLGRWSFAPAAAGFGGGMLFLLALDRLIPHLHLDAGTPEGPRSGLAKSALLMFAVTLHNIPEGMAVGVVLAGAAGGSADVTLAAAVALSVGIAIQNFPEGAVIAMPLRAAGASRRRAFLYGAASGAVEPLAALAVLALADTLVPALPYLLAFAAGAMLYVVVEELIPEASQGEHSNIGTVGFALGFALMMALDVALA